MPTKTVYDAATAGAALTSPIWLQYLQEGSAAVAAIGGAVIVLIRVALIIREWRSKQKGKS